MNFRLMVGSCFAFLLNDYGLFESIRIGYGGGDDYSYSAIISSIILLVIFENLDP